MSKRRLRPRACGAVVRALAASLFVFLLSGALATGQPSGGPYGPVRQAFPLPEIAGRVIYAAPDGAADSDGARPEAPTSLESALEKAVGGDLVLLRGGVYRTGSLVFNQGITLQAYGDEQPVLKGTRVPESWEPLGGGLWRTKWTRLFPAKPADWWRRERNGMKTPLHRFNNDMVFVDGECLKSVGWEGELDAHSFFVDYEGGYVYVAFDPAGRLVEITAHDSALVRTVGECHGRKSDGRGPTLRGLTFTQYAYRALEVEGREPEGLSDPSSFGKDVVGTLLEHVSITYCSRVGAYLRGDRTVLRNCLISDTSTEGLYLLSSADCLLERNIFRRNNIEDISGYFPAAVKIFNQCYRTVCRDNLVIDQPLSNGIWYDVGNVDGVFVNNWVQGALSGFFFEISKGALCAGNVFVDCGKGVYVLNSSDVTVTHNTFVNAPATFERTERSAVADHFGWHPSAGPDVDKREGHAFFGNLLAAAPSFGSPLLGFVQSKALAGKLTRPQARLVDGNLYVGGGEKADLVAWAPVGGEAACASYKTLALLRKALPGVEEQGARLDTDLASLFRSPELSRYDLLPGLQPAPSPRPLSGEILSALGWTRGTELVPGAYQRP